MSARAGAAWLATRRRALAGACAAGSVALLVPSMVGGGGDVPRSSATPGVPPRSGATPGPGAAPGPDAAPGPGAAPNAGPAAGPAAGAGVGPGLVRVPVRMADGAAVALLRAGERVDVLAVDVEPPGEVRTVAAGLEVVAVPRADLAGEGALLMLAATPAQARELARESAVARLSFTIPGR